MAEGKNTIVVYRDWKPIFDKLTDDEAGKLIKHFFSYVNDEEKEAPDRLTELIFEPIKQTLKRDLKKWERFIKKQQENGNKGGRPRNNPNPDEPKKPKPFFENPDEPKKTDSVSDSVSDSNYKETGDKSPTKEERQKTFYSKIAEFTKDYSKETLREFYEYWIESNDNGKKMRFEMEKVFDIKRRLSTWDKNNAKFKKFEPKEVQKVEPTNIRIDPDGRRFTYDKTTQTKTYL